MKTLSEIQIKLENDLNVAWSGKPNPEERATFWLGVAETAHASKLTSSETMTGLCEYALDCASNAVKEYESNFWRKIMFWRS